MNKLLLPFAKNYLVKITLFSIFIFSSMQLLAQTYCTPSGAMNCGSNDRINRVIFANLDYGLNNCATSGYGNYTSQIANVIPGQTYKMAVAVANGGTEYVKVWIDFNQNGTLNDAGEEFSIGNGTGGVTFVNDITIPANALAGNTRMRVRVRYNANPDSPCATAGTYGEVEDYTVNISNRATCINYTASLAAVQPTSCNNNGSITVSPSWGSTGSSLLWYRNTFTSASTAEVGGANDINGNAARITSGLPGPSAYMRLTENAGSRLGSLIVSNPNGFNASSFLAEFNIYMGGGTSADGFSFSYGPDVAHGQGENGSPGGLALRFDSYNNTGQSCAPTTAGQVSVGVYYGGTLVASTCINPVNMRGMWQNAFIYVNASNELTLRVGNQSVVPNLPLPAAYASANKSTWQWGFSARTGGAYDWHVIDNVSIYANNQAEYSLDNATWQASNVFSGLAPGTYTVYMRTRQINADCTGSNAVGTVVLGADYTTPAPTTPNQWNVSCYNGNNFEFYHGYYTQNTVSFNTATKWANSPSDANAVDGSSYVGCSIPIDYHSYSYRRTGFPCGKYTFSILGHDDDVYVYIDANGDGDVVDAGDFTYVHNGCCDAHSSLWTGYLTASSNILIRTREGVGGSYTNIELLNVTPTITSGALTLNGMAADVVTCANTPISVTQAGGSFPEATYCYWIGTNNGSNWVNSWDIWNGVSCNTSPAPNATFSTPGNYVVHTNAYNNVCGWDYHGGGSTRLVTISAPPSATLNNMTASICHGNEVNLSGSVTATGPWTLTLNSGGTVTGTGSGSWSTTTTPSATTNYTISSIVDASCTGSGTGSASITLPTRTNVLATNGESATCTVNSGETVHFYNTSSGRYIASITANATGLGSTTATTYTANDPNASPIATQACDDASYTTATLGRHWVINPTTNTAATVRLPYYDQELQLLVAASGATTTNPNDQVAADASNLGLSKYSGPANVNSSWNDNCPTPVSTGDGGTTWQGPNSFGNLSAYVPGWPTNTDRYSLFNISGFSEFWLHASSPTVSPLSVTLTNFTANCDGKVTWATASEQNSDYFTLERSRDGYNWDVVTTTSGAGTTNAVNNYEVMDNVVGNIYYRLKQTDFDGKTEVFGPIYVDCGTSVRELIVYPNPNTGTFTVALSTSENIGESTLVIYDVSGKEVVSRDINVLSGMNTVYFEDTHLVRGTYLVSVKGKDKKTFIPVKLIIQ